MEFKEQVSETQKQRGTRSHFCLLLLLRIDGKLPRGELGKPNRGNERETDKTTKPGANPHGAISETQQPLPSMNATSKGVAVAEWDDAAQLNTSLPLCMKKMS